MKGDIVPEGVMVVNDLGEEGEKKKLQSAGGRTNLCLKSQKKTVGGEGT